MSIQIHAKLPEIQIPPNIVHAKYNTFTVVIILGKILWIVFGHHGAAVG